MEDRDQIGRGSLRRGRAPGQREVRLDPLGFDRDLVALTLPAPLQLPDPEGAEREKEGPRAHGECRTTAETCGHRPVRVLDGARAGQGGTDTDDRGDLGSRERAARQYGDGRYGSRRDNERPAPPRHEVEGPYPFEWVRFLALRAILDVVQQGLAALLAFRDHDAAIVTPTPKARAFPSVHAGGLRGPRARPDGGSRPGALSDL